MSDSSDEQGACGGPSLEKSTKVDDKYDPEPWKKDKNDDYWKPVAPSRRYRNEYNRGGISPVCHTLSRFASSRPDTKVIMFPTKHIGKLIGRKTFID